MIAAPLRERLVKIGAKVVSHGRYVTFQMAEVAVPRAAAVRGGAVAHRPAAGAAGTGVRPVRGGCMGK